MVEADQEQALRIRSWLTKRKIIMAYFSYFPNVDYFFGENEESSPFQNIALYSRILDDIKDESTAYRLIQVQNGERPDVLSQRLYGTTDLHWTFYLLNDKIRDQGWPLSQEELLKKMSKDVPGECVVAFGETTNSSNGNKQHVTVGQFPIGTNIFGSISGAAGVVYAKNPLLGQIFIRKTNAIKFQPNETVVDTITASPAYSLVISEVHSPAYFAYNYVEDANGNNVDVDYSADFRGEASEGEVDLPGGVFDDPANPDIYANISPYNTVTFFEHYTNINDDLSKIKVLVPSVANKISNLFRESLKNG